MGKTFTHHMHYHSKFSSMPKKRYSQEPEFQLEKDQNSFFTKGFLRKWNSRVDKVEKINPK
jgi:hypothetical protein